MKNRKIINMMRAIRGESLAHQRARVKNSIRNDNKVAISTNWASQGRTGFNGEISQ